MRYDTSSKLISKILDFFIKLFKIKNTQKEISVTYTDEGITVKIFQINNKLVQMQVLTNDYERPVVELDYTLLIDPSVSDNEKILLMNLNSDFKEYTNFDISAMLHTFNTCADDIRP